MQSTSDRPAAPDLDIEDLRLPIPVQPRPPRTRAVRIWFRVHGADLAWLPPLLAVAGAVHVVGMERNPGFTDVESGNVAAASGAGWPAGFSLGRAQIAAWTRLTGAFDRVDDAVVAGREAMLVVTLVSVVLLWVLARRLGLPRVAAAAAVSVFALSPLAIHVHRMVYLDNLAMAWVLAALALATARRRQPFAFTAAAGAAALAVLTQVTFLLFTPFVVWFMWQGTGSRLRRRALAVTGTSLAVVGYAYLLLSVVGRDPLPGEENAALWWDLDPVLFLAGAVAGVGALAFEALRPAASALVLVLLLVALPSGSTPVTLPIAMVALTALLVPGAVHQLAIRFRRRRGRADLVPLGIMCATAVAAAVLAAAVAWPGEVRELVRADRNAATVQSERWLESNVGPDSRLIADRTISVELAWAGFPAENVVPFDEFEVEAVVDPVAGPEADDPAASVPLGWRHYDYLVSTPSMRSDTETRPDVTTAMAQSSAVAVFGTADERVEIRRIHPLGLRVAEAVAAGERRATRYAAGQLLRNDALHFDDDAAAAVRAGLVDPRIVLVLGRLSGTYDLTVSLPALPGEDDRPRRRLALADVGTDDEAARLGLWLLGQPEPFTPTDADVDGADVVTTYSVAAPGGLLPDPPETND